MLQMNLWDKQNKLKWNLLVVYGAAHDDHKLEFLSELSAFCSKNSDPILIGGDFNIIRFANERNKPHGLNRISYLFNSLINFYELEEIVMSGGLFTWSNHQDNPTLEKLDRILVSKDWEDVFPTVLVRRLPREVSDYNPFILTTSHGNPLKHIQFKFELSWLDNPDFFTTVDKIWSRPCRAISALDKIQ